ncbi:PfkB family carbohydrate kinase [Paenibacillus sp. MZ04-78.2]|uniref:PfkB family carbohydrate kinase n=1 Tax=Paenibacillus sp. MZ04-78.2 TaxID=2962034 RepID=UPI0020B69C13|nr:PfkB family carbohydrate kinase [Paenibacillus sp. MZ04-78.2]MCP3776060.1 PfkB family carbohydrate kinase [Paenibacillus sp. MZ04-78.2]
MDMVMRTSRLPEIGATMRGDDAGRRIFPRSRRQRGQSGGSLRQDGQAVDTTAAGDTFSGTLAAMIIAGKSMDEAVDIAQRASSIVVTRLGAQDAIPVLSEVV